MQEVWGLAIQAQKNQQIIQTYSLTIEFFYPIYRKLIKIRDFSVYNP